MRIDSKMPLKLKIIFGYSFKSSLVWPWVADPNSVVITLSTLKWGDCVRGMFHVQKMTKLIDPWLVWGMSRALLSFLT